ncbi:MAG: 50S ribosomal protein L35 [Candidatus Cloacimonetes bacterium]|jgi:large subunit ribosomal protein L35|nr:50S ribosomal protein L35 [Candidatus Cloacimonadota bacterium]
MPKMRTHRAAAKRFKLTGTGKIKRHHAKAAHIKTKKSRKLKRHLRASAVAMSVDVPRIKKMLGC